MSKEEEINENHQLKLRKTENRRTVKKLLSQLEQIETSQDQWMDNLNL